MGETETVIPTIDEKTYIEISTSIYTYTQGTWFVIDVAVAIDGRHCLISGLCGVEGSTNHDSADLSTD